MKKNNYSLDKDLLSIKTECGEFKFKIDGDRGLANARQVADLMVAEMEKVEEKVKHGREKSSPYAKLLLSNLNLADRHVRLETQYSQLVRAYKDLKTQQPSQVVPGRASDLRQPSQPEPKPEPPATPPVSVDDRESCTHAEGKPPVKETQIKKPENPGQRLVPRRLPEQKGAFQTEQKAEPHTQTSGRQESLAEKAPKLSGDKEKNVPKETSVKEASVKETPVSEPVNSPEPENLATDEPSSAARTPEPPGQPGPLVRQVLNTLKKSRSHLMAGDISQEQTLVLSEPGPDPVLPRPLAPDDSTGPGDPDPCPPAEPKAQAAPSPQLKINRARTGTPRQGAPADGGSRRFQLPSLGFLRQPEEQVEVDHEAIRRDAELLEQKLSYFGIKGEVMEVSPGPVITTFEYRPAPGIKISKIVNLADDLALALSALSIRLVAPIPGKDVIGIEIPNSRMSVVPFMDIVGSDAFHTIDSRLPICLGKDIIGNPVVVALEKMPHLLIAGATGTGKSVALNAMITSILYKSSPDQVKFIMIDPKRIELSLFNDIPHLITPVITDMKKANIALQWVVREMEQRYEKLARLQVRNIEQYNRKIQGNPVLPEDEDGYDPFSYIVVIIDELADLMMTASKDIEFSLTRIAQMARAAGIHLILATQRPSVDVLTGIIKANFPTRISFQVSSKTDSRTIIDANGAETLLGRGDMLFVPPGTARLTRVHGTYLSEEELMDVTEALKAQGKPRYVLDVITEKEQVPMAEATDDDYDEKYQAALEYVLASRQASISSVQRALRIGYNRAARIIDLMEKKGIVSTSDGVRPRQVLVDRVTL